MSRRYLPAALGGAAAIALIWGFWELAEDLATSTSLKMFDNVVSASIQSARTPALTSVMKAVTFTGDTLAVTVATVLLVFVLAYARKPRQAAFSAMAVAGASAAVFLLKDAVGRSRPGVENALIALPGSFSFPSGHAIGSLCLAWVVSYAVIVSRMGARNKAFAISACVVYALLVGISRVYLGVHWPSDVLASWFLGGSLIAFSTGVYQSYRLSRRKRP